VQIWPRSKFESRLSITIHGVQKLSSKGTINCTASINSAKNLGLYATHTNRSWKQLVISVKEMWNSSRTYIAIPKGRGFLYSHDQFLRAVSHSIDVHTDALQPSDDASSDNDGEQATPPETTPSTPTPDASPSPVPSASVASDSCDVCLIAPREGFALVPCGHARFCEYCCANAVSTMGAGCPICRTEIQLVMHVFN